MQDSRIEQKIEDGGRIPGAALPRIFISQS